jgi:protein ImuB
MYGVIYVADFHLQAALRAEPQLRSRPIALLDGQLPKAVVLQVTEAARAAGVCPGLTSTQAMARCREVILRSRSPGQEQAARDILLQCAYCFSPGIEDTSDGVCTMDLKGLPVTMSYERASGDADQDDDPRPSGPHRTLAVAEIARWAEKILDALAQLQLHAQVGVARTPDLAWQAAKCARPFLLVEDAEQFISGLPIGHLEPPAEISEILEKWGIRTVGAFLALGKDKIGERLGAEAVELFDLASSRQARPLRLVVPAETFQEAIEFEEPIEMLEPLLFILRRFIEQLALRLEAIYVVAQEIELHLGLCSGDTYQKLFRIPAPTREVETLFRTLHTHLENARTDSPIGSLRLCLKPCRPRQDQFSLFEAALRDPNQFHETLARLGALLGNGRAGTPYVEDTHRPDSFHIDPAALCHGQADWDLTGPGTARNGEERTQGLALRRFRPPVAATVELRNARPVLLHCPLFTSAIVQSRGPWNLSGNWWDNQSWVRQEWDVQTRDGELYRLVRENGEWLVEGIMD